MGKLCTPLMASRPHRAWGEAAREEHPNTNPERKQVASSGIYANKSRPLEETLTALASFIVVLLLVVSSASAATLNLSEGQLLGASGVIVDGNSYDVEFLDGTCSALYSGCNEVSDFTFQTPSAATLAAQALLDQVFLDLPDFSNFDTQPNLTNGCGSTVSCSVFTPYTVGGANIVTFQSAVNEAAPGGDFVVGAFTGTSIFDNLSLNPNTTYAIWSLVAVPEPGTALLLGLGLVGLGARRQRRENVTQSLGRRC